MSTINLIECATCGNVVDAKSADYGICDECMEAMYVASLCNSGTLESCNICPNMEQCNANLIPIDTTHSITTHDDGIDIDFIF